MNNCENCKKLSACLEMIDRRKGGTCPLFKDLLEFVYEDNNYYCIVNGEVFYTLEQDKVVLDRIEAGFHVIAKYDLIDGERYVKYIQSGYFDDMGDCCGVIVDDYVANLRLGYDEKPDAHCGDWRLHYDMWQELCSKHDVTVNWANN